MFLTLPLILLSIPLPLFLAPLNNFIAFFFFCRSLFRPTLIQFIYPFIAILTFLFVILRSYHNSFSLLFLLSSRYIFFLLPLFAFPFVYKAVNNRNFPLLSTYLLFLLPPLLLLFGALTLPICTNNYGSYCIFLSKSSSLSSAFTSSLFIILFTELLDTIQYFSINLKSVSRCLLLLASLFSILFISFSSGSRLGLVCIIAFLTLFVSSNVVSFLLSFLKSRSLISPRLIFFAIFLFPLSFLLFPFFGLGKSFSRLYTDLPNLVNDPRLGGQGTNYVISSRFDLNFLEQLLGKGAFSIFETWDQSSAYDSTLNLFLTDFGIVFSLFFIGSLLLYWFKVLRSLGFVFSPKASVSSAYNIHYLFINYIILSSTNEFLFLKAFNPFFVLLLAYSLYLNIISVKSRSLHFLCCSQ